MFNTQVSRAYDIGSKVELILDCRGLKAGWHGTIKEIGVTPNNPFHEYTIEDDQEELHTIPGNLLRPWLGEARKELQATYDNLSLFFKSELEEEDYFKIRSMATLGETDPLFLSLVMYQYGKTQGKSQERLERKRKHLMKKYPDMRESTKRASNKAIEIADKMKTLTQEERELLISFITKEKEPQTTLTR